ncbi:MAG: hypothetical protein HFI75_05575 [Lachnospiraceae bacterium]|nr:hypothetical protein [Lachnospiraceae bacterium]
MKRTETVTFTNMCMIYDEKRAGAGITLAEGMQTMLQLFCGDCTEQFFYLEHGSWVEALK